MAPQEPAGASGTLRSLTGDEEPLLATVEHGLRQRGYELRAAAQAAQTLGTTAKRLVPALTTALHATLARPGPGQQRGSLRSSGTSRGRAETRGG